MGASLVYLNEPNTDIDQEDGKNSYLEYATGSMQGWRLNMVCNPNYQYMSLIYSLILDPQKRYYSSKFQNFYKYLCLEFILGCLI